MLPLVGRPLILPGPELVLEPKFSRTIRITAPMRRKGTTIASGPAVPAPWHRASLTTYAYFHDDDALLVNLFVASEVVWKRADGVVAIVQDTDYPNTDAVRLTVREAGDGRFALKLRIPAWADGATLRVNGKTEDVATGAFATVRRRWKAGDTIAMVVPQPLRRLPIDAENPNLAALMRGAVMYVGLNPWEGIGEQSVTLPGSLSPLPSSGQAYRTVSAGRDLVFVQYFTIDTERYNTYFRIA